MKQLFTFLIISIFALTPAFSQLQTDLQLTMTSPAETETIPPMQGFPITVTIKNTGTETLQASDTIAYYLLMNGDSILFFPQNENHIDYTDNLIVPGDSITISRTMIFDNSFLGQTVEICIFVKPRNSATPVEDPQLANNKDCAVISVIDETGIEEQAHKALVIYPNPASGQFTVTQADGSPVGSFFLSDPSGKRFDPVMKDEHTIDCSGLPAGIYLLVADGWINRVVVL